MNTLRAFAALFAITATVVACSSSGSDDSDSADDDNVDQGPEQDVITTKNQLQGSWTVSDESKDLTADSAYEFNANGTFSREVAKILNGVMIQGAPRPTEHQTGKYTVNASKHQVTLHVTSPNKSDSTLSYAYSGGKSPSLTLTGIAAPGSHVAFPAIKFDQKTLVGAEGATCGGFVGLPCAAGFVCKAAASCCDLPGKCTKKL